MDFEHTPPEVYGAFWDFLKPKAKSSESMPVLSQGSTGIEVQQLQELLGTGVDGHFGPSTTVSVKAFQSSVGLPATGTVDQKTWAYLLGEKKVGGQIQISKETGGAIVDAAGQLLSLFQKPSNADQLMNMPTNTPAPQTSGSWIPTVMVVGGTVVALGIGGFFLYKYAAKD